MANSYVLVQDKVMTLVNEAEAGEHKFEQSVTVLPVPLSESSQANPALTAMLSLYELPKNKMPKGDDKCIIRIAQSKEAVGHRNILLWTLYCCNIL